MVFSLFATFGLPNPWSARALSHKIKTVEIKPYHVRRGYFNPIFKGVVLINLVLEDGRKTFTFLPYNLHAQSKIVGRQRNNPVVNVCGMHHYCLPLSWSLFDIKKASYYSPDHKRSHHIGTLNKPFEYVHFDNSISIMHQPKGLTYMLWEMEMHKMGKDSLKWWNGEGKEYVEFCSFDTLKGLFEARFVEGRRRSDLFNALGLIHKPLSRQHKEHRKQDNQN